MSKELEALKDIKELFTCHDFDLLEKCSAIEKALKGKEKTDKALEIIKRTHLNVGAFMLLCKGDHEYTPNTTYEQYVCFCEKQGEILGDKIHSFPCYRMTQEEYDLVLGVLYGKETS